MDLQRFTALTGALLLGHISTVLAHGGEDMSANAALSQPELTLSSNFTGPATHFQYGEQSTLMMAHIVLMTAGWVFVLPVGKWP